MWKNSPLRRVLRVVLPTALLAAAGLLGVGCQRFDAAEPMGGEGRLMLTARTILDVVREGLQWGK